MEASSPSAEGDCSARTGISSHGQSERSVITTPATSDAIDGSSVVSDRYTLLRKFLPHTPSLEPPTNREMALHCAVEQK